MKITVQGIDFFLIRKGDVFGISHRAVEALERISKEVVPISIGLYDVEYFTCMPNKLILIPDHGEYVSDKVSIVKEQYTKFLISKYDYNPNIDVRTLNELSISNNVEYICNYGSFFVKHY